MPNSTARKAVYRKAIRTTVIGLLFNLGLGLVKLVGGVLGNSLALISDAVNSLGDVLTSLVVYAGLRVAQRPADEEHPYGHTRAEVIAASNVALILILSALAVAWEAIRHFHVEHTIPPAWTLWIAGGTSVIKEALYRYQIHVARITGSMALVANAWDHRADALCSLAVLLGLGLVRWGGDAFIWADEAAALCVVAAILWTALQLFLQSTSELMDIQAEPDMVEQMRKAAMGVDGVVDVETLRVRKSGLEYFADIHVEVASDMNVADGHRIGHDVKDQLQQRFSTLRDVLVHLEPHPNVGRE